MKKRWLILAILPIILMLTSARASIVPVENRQNLAAEQTGQSGTQFQQTQWVLPASINMVEEDAFAGTPLTQEHGQDARRSDDSRIKAVSYFMQRVDQGFVRFPSIFRLPLSLLQIEEEAFEGTLPTDILLGEEIVSIGERAFASIPSLRRVYIPDKVSFIGEHAFESSGLMMITGNAGSYARTWARASGIPFAPVRTMRVHLIETIPSVSANAQTMTREVTGEDAHARLKMGLQWRRTGEIKVETYESQLEHQIQGRSPPQNA